jgi:hypothetical protein
MLAIGRLEGIEEIVGGEVKVELIENDFFKELGQEREIGNRTIVFEVVWVEVVFFQERADESRLESVRDSASLERSVDDVGDERQ